MQPETDSKIETVARKNLARVLESDIAADNLDLDVDMAGVYGLTSLNKVLFLMSALRRRQSEPGKFHRTRRRGDDHAARCDQGADAPRWRGGLT
ncbi:hypothetical protein ACVWXU_008673 [Streptomyces sp. TE33382]